MPQTAEEELDELRKKYPLPRERHNWNILREDPNFLDTVLEMIMEGNSVVDIAGASGLPSGRINSWLVRLEGKDKERFLEARQIRATTMAERMLTHLKEIQAGTLPVGQGRLIIDTLKWHAERLDPHIWGNKLQVRAEVKTTVQMHLEAVRELAERVKRGDERPVIEGYVEPKMVPEDEPTAEELLG